MLGIMGEIIDFIERGYKVEDISTITGYKVDWIKDIKERLVKNGK